MARSSCWPSNGTELLDWQEVWCMRCRHDHGMHTDTGPGCEIMARALVDDDTPEVVQSGYVIHFEQGTHTIPNVCNSLPAAAFCTAWEPCEPQCMTHVNGAIIQRIERTDEPYRDGE